MGTSDIVVKLINVSECSAGLGNCILLKTKLAHWRTLSLGTLSESSRKLTVREDESSQSLEVLAETSKDGLG